MGNPSNMHIRIPRPITRGKPITASWLNELRDAVQALNEKGFSLPSQQTRKVDPPRFNPLSIRKIVDGENVTFGVKVGFGVIVEIIPKGGETSPPDATLEHIPLIQPPTPEGGDPPDKIPLDGETEIIIGDGDTVFVKYRTDDMGYIFGEPGEEEEDKRPTIEFDAAPPSSVHYQPPNPGESEGVDGEYHIKLFKLSANAETGATEIEYFCQSDIFHYHEVWKGENTGAGAEVFKERDAEADSYKFRTLEGRYGIKEEQNEDDIKFDFWGENQGTGAAVYLFDPDAPVVDGASKWRTLRGLSSGEASDEGITPQLRVEIKNEPGEALPDAQAKTVLFRGNGKKGSRVWLQCDETTEIARIEWADGFVTSEGDVNIIVGDCPGSSTEPPPP